MADFDGGFKITSHSSGREMCWLRGIRPDVWEPIGDTLQTTERLADRAFRAAEDGQRFVVYFEAYTTWRDDALWNMLSKSALLSERERLPTRTFVFVLTPTGYREQNDTFRLAVEEETTQQVWFRTICLWRERPQPWWERVPGLMALLPLCDHGQGEEEVVSYAAQNILTQVTDIVVSANLLTSLGFFGRLAYPHLDAFAIIGRENMRESPFYQQIMDEGRVEGRVEGRAEGELSGRRTAILEALETRFGSGTSAEFRDVLETITESARLSELFRTALKCRSIGWFRRALRTHES